MSLQVAERCRYPLGAALPGYDELVFVNRSRKIGTAARCPEMTQTAAHRVVASTKGTVAWLCRQVPGTWKRTTGSLGAASEKLVVANPRAERRQTHKMMLDLWCRPRFRARGPRQHVDQILVIVLAMRIGML